MTTGTGLSDFHKMTLTVTKAFYKNKKQILSRTGIINAFLIKRLCLTLKIVFFKWLLRKTILSLINLKQLSIKVFKDMLPQKSCMFENWRGIYVYIYRYMHMFMFVCGIYIYICISIFLWLGLTLISTIR